MKRILVNVTVEDIRSGWLVKITPECPAERAANRALRLNKILMIVTIGQTRIFFRRPNQVCSDSKSTPVRLARFIHKVDMLCARVSLGEILPEQAYKLLKPFNFYLVLP